MNGVALLVALATLGVDYNVQQAEDGKLEYVIQIEAEFLKSLADGQEIHSDVPPEAGAVERVLVRVGTAPAKHSQANISEYRRLLVNGSRFASTDPRTAPDGSPSIVWPAKTKPALNYNVKYGWQPDQAGHLAYYVQLDPTLLQMLAAGDEIRAGIDPAAGRVGRFVIRAGSDDLPKIPVEPVATTAPLADAGRGRFGAPTQGTYGPALSTSPARRPTTPLPSTPDYSATSPAVTPLPAEQPAYAPRFGANDPRTAAGQQPTYAPPTGQYLDNQYGPPRAAMEPPPIDYGPPSYVARTAAEQQQPQLPARTYAPPAQYAQQPEDRLATAPRSGTAAGSPLPAPQISTTGASRSAVEGIQPEKPWLPLMFTAFALFMSIGGNLYLGWTAAEFYSRYRLATERLRSAGRT